MATDQGLDFSEVFKELYADKVGQMYATPVILGAEHGFTYSKKARLSKEMANTLVGKELQKYAPLEETE